MTVHYHAGITRVVPAMFPAMINFGQYILGETATPLDLETREENQLATVHLLRQCRHSLDIVSRELDPMIYDRPEVIEAIRQMILTRQRCRVRIVVFNARTIAQRGHQLLQLAGDLSSFIELRQAAPEHNDYPAALLIADVCGYLRRPQSSRYEASVCFNDRRQAQVLLNEFEMLWTAARSDVNLRRLAL